MAARNAKQVSILKSWKRKQQNDNLDKIIDDSNNTNVNEDDGDGDYVPSPKKTKKKSVKKANSTENKHLTPKQRLDRLKKKIVSKQLMSTRNELETSNVDEAIQSSSMSIASVQNSTEKQHTSITASNDEKYEEYFVDDNIQIIPIHKDDELMDILNRTENGPNLMDLTVDKIDGDILNGLKPTIQNSALNVQQSESTDIAQMLASLIAKVDDMKGEFFALRRQIARLEAKLALNRKPNPAHSSFELDDNVFLDFESTLAAEGLPIKSVQGVNALEKRLKETAYSASPYRQKLVSITAMGFDIVEY